MTATAATNGYRQRSATAHNTRTISDTSAYATPERRTLRPRHRPVGPGVVQQRSTATSWTASGSERLPSTADLPQRPRATSLPRVRIEGGSRIQSPQLHFSDRFRTRYRPFWSPYSDAGWLAPSTGSGSDTSNMQRFPPRGGAADIVGVGCDLVWLVRRALA
jgi:hypothetical protein